MAASTKNNDEEAQARAASENAMQRAMVSLVEQARRTATNALMLRKAAYEREPWQLDLLADDLSKMPREQAMQRIRELQEETPISIHNYTMHINFAAALEVFRQM